MKERSRVLIVKLASMGDLLHLLPAITDAKRARPELLFDRVVDHRFAEVDSWHPGIDRILTTDHRTWRSSPFTKKTREEFRAFLHTLRNTEYDLVIDAQGNLKTALLSLFAKGRKVGADGSSVQEWGAHLFYDRKVRFSKRLHAVEKLRILFSEALGYPLPTTPPDYGIDKARLRAPSFPLPPEYLVFVPIASFPSKLPPDSFWKELIRKASVFNLPILLPWGSSEEQQRAALLAKGHPDVIVLPKLPLSEIGAILLGAQGVVSADTGLSHISAALDTPCVTLYGPTDPSLIGTIGKNQSRIRTPCLCPGRKSCSRPDSFCLSKLSSEEVILRLEEVIQGAKQV